MTAITAKQLFSGNPLGYARKLRKFEVTIWEKAEHWTFTDTIEAYDETDAYARAGKEWPKRSYSIRNVHPK